MYNTSGSVFCKKKRCPASSPDALRPVRAAAAKRLAGIKSGKPFIVVLSLQRYTRPKEKSGRAAC
ncbi:hypothetical protein JJQ72_19480 [Paenibacillus sp. F411]|uniref:hypothetical protein n=1 Tax=Paenibacillus sp. F411 TaxID=2820239 RepID=UPI001AAE46C9|nr:hypothetical protein [Paenibacillus sp. F411]MBO2946162.1 hypothetical protein [Paenibacillus sp. F411]